jgi:hypothetical protein
MQRDLARGATWRVDQDQGVHHRRAVGGIVTRSSGTGPTRTRGAAILPIPRENDR